nr:class I SAM-dependent methyltransferase [Acanthopleuribacter pedis]
MSSADPIVRAHYPATADADAVATKRWQKAQRAESQFWRTWRQNTLYKDVSLYDFWLEVVEKTGGPLAPGRTLDVGCGPVSVLNFVRPKGMQPFGLDPLAEVYAREKLIECRDDVRPMPIAGLPAERMPFLDESLDQVICLNVLDHVSDAPRVLAEIHRVLKKDGYLRLYVHTFASWIKRFLFFDTPHTYHWDHEEFKALVEAGGFKIVHELMEPKTFDLPETLLGKLGFFPYWVATKVAYTSYFKVQRV